MIRVCIICEGPTEVEFVNRCLEPYLRTSGISAYGTLLSARSGRHRGGRVTVDRLANKISLHYGEADRVTTLVDFYGFQDRQARGRAQLEADIAATAHAMTTGYDQRFVLPYVQMHEFEGLLFTDTSAFEWAEDGWSDEVETALTAVARAFASPEDINDSPETAPSKRIEKIFPAGAYSKPEHGPLIAEAIGIDAIREKCPAFDAWVRTMQAWGMNPSDS